MAGGPVGLKGHEIAQSRVQSFAVAVLLNVVHDRGPGRQPGREISLPAHTSNDNPFSEAIFQDVEIPSRFPEELHQAGTREGALC